MVGQQAARQQAAQQHGLPGLLDQHGSRSPTHPARSGLARPQRNGRWMGSVGLVRWWDASVLRRKGCAKAFCFAGSMMTADGGFWMVERQAAGLAHHRPTTGNTTPTPTAPHKCPTWGIDQPNRTMHPLHRSLALNMVPKGDPRDRGFRTVFTHRKQASASDHSPKPLHRTTNPPTLPNLKFKYPNFGSSTVLKHRGT